MCKTGDSAVNHTYRTQIFVASILISSSFYSSSTIAQDAEELARAAQNPLASLISVPFQNNTNFEVGPEEDVQNVLNIQPVVPFSLNEKWNLITRTIIPVISQPGFNPDQSRKNGLGDIQFTSWASPKAATASGWVWGVGAVAQLDTASDDRLGSGAWGLGPTAVVLKSSGPWVFGGLINNIWSVSTDRDEVNQMLVQPFVNYNFPDKPGRYLTFAPIITANWEADNDNVWTVPLGLGIGQVTRFGKQPVNMQASVYYNVVTPDFGAKWQLRLQLQLMFPK
jgi:hypothetical protein